MIDQTVSSIQKLLSNVNIFVCPPSEATCQMCTTSPLNFQSTAPSMAKMPPTSTKNWTTSVHSTAFIPPNTVYRVVKPPITVTHAQTGQPMTCCSAIDIA